MLQELKIFFKSTPFSKAILVGVAVTTPILLGIQFDQFEIGLAICFGAFWCSPSDVGGRIQHKTIGILAAIFLIVIVSFIGGYLHLTGWFIYLILGALTFLIAFISVYGFRASLISFSGLLALVLSFAHTSPELKIYEYALWIGVGGLWYLSLSLGWYLLNPKGQTEELLSETFSTTADFIKTRGDLIDPNADRKKLVTQLLQLQTALTDHHASLREVLLLSRKKSGRSMYQAKRLMVFVQLVEILETAIANPVNYDKMDALFKEHPQFNAAFQKILFSFSDQLQQIGRSSKNPKKFPKTSVISDALDQLEVDIAPLKTDPATHRFEQYLMLQNLLDYQRKICEKLKRIKWLLGKPELSSTELVDQEVLTRFIIPQEYDPIIALQNLSFKSTIFKHSLRLAVTMMIGYLIGSLLEFQNPYWILLTIIVIMRPSYGLTKSRSIDRIIGTLLGGVLATGLVFLIQDPYVYGILGVISLIIAFSMVQRNYKASATFITLSVVFIYAIIRPDVFTVIQYRIFDTLIGAALSFTAMVLLWPAWGFLEINVAIEKSINANKEFLQKISRYYEVKGKVPTSYKIARKTAFLETANLSAAFQRMVQEPKSKQKNIDHIYEIVALNQSLLSALASLSTYIQEQPTTPATNRFHQRIHTIEENLNFAVLNLQKTQQPSDIAINNLQKNTRDFIPISLLQKEKLEHLQKEAHLISEQLKWMETISNKMGVLTAKISRKTSKK
ncbi:FUSC family protein [Flavobacteriaceae bacterium F08102]|nr:FUSC family protein [Flavobacteriaceae bacterium F08102]